MRDGFRLDVDGVDQGLVLPAENTGTLQLNDRKHADWGPLPQRSLALWSSPRPPRNVTFAQRHEVAPERRGASRRGVQAMDRPLGAETYQVQLPLRLGGLQSGPHHVILNQLWRSLEGLPNWGREDD
jgi:hypothetical protein